MKHCTNSHSVLGLTQWTEVIITHIVQIRIMELQQLSPGPAVGFHVVTTAYIAQ